MTERRSVQRTGSSRAAGDGASHLRRGLSVRDRAPRLPLRRRLCAGGVLEHPEVVAQLHRDFLHAGSDVMLAFTYYAHREKLRVIGKEDALEEMTAPRYAWRGRRHRGATRWSPATCPTPTSSSTANLSRPARCAPCSTSRWAGPSTRAWTTSSPRPSPSSARRCSHSKQSRRPARRRSSTSPSTATLLRAMA